MYTKKKFKKMRPNDSYIKYDIKEIKNKIKKYTCDTPKSIYLCLRFPFLYPRNRFSGKHYTNWKLRNKCSEIFKKWSVWSGEHTDEYVKKFGEQCTFMDGHCVKVEYILKLATLKDRFLYWWYNTYENILGIFHCIPTYTELDAMDKGWRKRFGIQFCKELKHAILKSGGKKYMKDFRITQIKEKWGQFECYVNMYSPEVSRVIEKYGYISQYVCVECGDDGVKKTIGWICPYCEKHLPENQNWIWIDPVYGWSNPEHKEYNENILEK